MLAAAIAHLALDQRDAVGLTLFADRVLAHVKPRAKANQLDEILATMVRLSRSDAGRVGRACSTRSPSSCPGAGWWCWSATCSSRPTTSFRASTISCSTGTTSWFFTCSTRVEHHLPLEGQVRFHDLETGEELTTQVDEIRAGYTSGHRRAGRPSSTPAAAAGRSTGSP